MNRLSISSLRVRILFLVLLAVVPALVLMLTSAEEQRRLAKEEAQANALRLARLAAANQKQLIEGARQFLSALAHLPLIRGYDGEGCSKLLAELLQGHSQYSNAIVVKPDGELFASAIPFKGKLNLSENTFFKRPIETRAFAIGEYKIGDVTGNAHVTFSYPVIGATSQIIGVIAVAMDLEWLNQIAARAQIPEKMFVAVMDQDGTYLARHPFPARFIGQKFSDAAVLAQMKAQLEGVAETPGKDGKLYGFTPLATAPISTGFVVIGVPLDIAFAEADRVFQRNMSVLLTVALLALVAAWVGGYIFIMRKVNMLVGATQKVRQGDLAARTGLPATGDELNQLGGSFDAMTMALQARTEERRKAEEALAYVASIVASSDDAIAGATMDGVITTWNSASGKLYGYLESEAKGKHLKILSPFSKMDELSKIMDRIAKDERVEHIDTVRVRKDGREVQVSITYSPIKDGSGRIIGVSSSARDITEHKKAEAAVRRSREKYEALVNAVEGIVWEADPETFQFTFVSRQSVKVIGFTPEEMIATPGFLKSRLHPEDKEIVLGFWEMAVQQHRPQTVEFRVTAADGRVVWFRDHISVVMEYDEPASLRGVMMDITRLREIPTRTWRKDAE